MRKSKYQIGAIVAVPLPGGKYAFAKIYKDLHLAVYDLVSNKIESFEDVISHKISFFLAVTDRPIKSGDWPVIGQQPFPDEESSWAPPMVVGTFPGMEVDPTRLKITHKGTGRLAKPGEAR